MAEKWENWSKSLKFSPREIAEPESEEELQELVRAVSRRGGTMRVVGQGHSSSPLVATGDTLVSLEKLDEIERVDREGCEAWVQPGISLKKMGNELLEHDLTVHNQGDVNVQQLGGAIGTGTHGTGKEVGNLSTMLTGVRMVCADGRVIEKTVEEDEDFVNAARVSMGVLGIFTSLRLKLLPAFKLHRQEWCTGVEQCMANLEELIEENQHFDFYWYPRSDEIKLRTWNKPGRAPNLKSFARLEKEGEDWAPKILSRDRHILFDEMEYCLPYEAGPEVFLEVRDRMRRKHRKEVAWRTLYRTTAPDGGFLSTNHDRLTATVSVHHNAGLPFWDFFLDLEPLMQEAKGRPHWGKKHTMRAEGLRGLYPKWEAFHDVRKRLDPQGVFMTDYLRELLGADDIDKRDSGDTAIIIA